MRKRHKIVLGAALACALLIVGAELFARFHLGLGDPMLWMDDPTIEYMFRPNQRGRQFGNEYLYNEYSMRSASMAPVKTDPNELRILFFGDSVLNGGHMTDQDCLATEIVRRVLQTRLQRPVAVGNISAGSWGPKNCLEYAKRFGLFGADVVVLVVSSHDYADNPAYLPVAGTSPIYPAEKPPCALYEAITRYLPMYLPRAAHRENAQENAVDEQAIAVAMDAARELVQMALSAEARVIPAQHLTVDEVKNSPQEGHRVFAELWHELGLPSVELGPAFADALKQGDNPYRDAIHPNALGQKIIAEALAEAVCRSLGSEMSKR